MEPSTDNQQQLQIDKSASGLSKIWNVRHVKDVGIHLAILLVLSIILIVLFFYVYLPSITRHGESITVPDALGLKVEELDSFFSSRQLRYEILPDTAYSAIYGPSTVIQQVPKANMRVKQFRKIYLTINSATPPKVRMPNLVDGSLKSAQMKLTSYNLKLGNVIYRPDPAFNAVLEQYHKGRLIQAGEWVEKGSEIDLSVGDGLGLQTLESPYLIGLDEESAKIAILGSGLQIGKVSYTTKSYAFIEKMNPDSTVVTTQVKVGPGEVVYQFPYAGANMVLKQTLDIQIYRPDSLKVRESLLDQ